MDYAVHNVPSYQNLQGSPQRAHVGSQSHNGSAGAPVHAVGGGGTVGHGTATKMSHGAPHGMDM